MIYEAKSGYYTVDNLNRRAQPLEIKEGASSVEEAFPDRIIKGYGSVTNVEDCYKDTILPGAFKQTLLDEFPTGFIKFLFAHKPDRSIGVPLVMFEDKKGLWGERKVSKVPDGDTALQLAFDRAMDSLSIGFWVRKHKLIGADGKELDDTASWEERWTAKRHITDLKLAEDSIVSWGANPMAKIEEVRSYRDRLLRLGEDATKDNFFEQHMFQMMDELRKLQAVQVQMKDGVDAFLALHIGDPPSRPDLKDEIKSDMELLKQFRSMLGAETTSADFK